MALTGANIRAALAAVGALGGQMTSLDNLAAGANDALRRAPAGLTAAGAAAFLATMAQESAYFRTTTEYSAGRNRYSPYDGRTFEMVTWESNYRGFGKWAKSQGLVSDPEVFVKNPKALADYRWAWDGGVWFFAHNGLWKYANRGDFLAVSQGVNGGNGTIGSSWKPSGWNARRAMYDSFLRLGNKLLPGGSAPSAIQHADTGQDLNAQSSTADIKALQKILGVTADGVAGPNTINALIVKAGYAKEASPTLDVKGSNTVKKVQARINQQMGTALTVDGLWGPATAISFHDYLAAGGKLTDLAGQQIVQPPKPAAAQLTVDGYLGADTLNRWAAVMGTHTGKADLVKAVQRFLNAKGARDEHGHKLVVDGKGLYNNTAQATAASHTQYALQGYLRMPVKDGRLSHPSDCIKEVQKRLNKAKTGSKEF